MREEKWPLRGSPPPLGALGDADAAISGSDVRVSGNDSLINYVLPGVVVDSRFPVD